MKSAEVAEWARSARYLIAGTEDLTELIRQAPHLEMISRVGIGLDGVNLDLCRQKGITVAYTPDAVTPAVSEFAVGLILDALRHATLADRQIRNGQWTRPFGTRLGKIRVGILGLGRVGLRVAQHLMGFMPVEVLIHDLVQKDREVEALNELSGSIHAGLIRWGKNYNPQPTRVRSVDWDTLWAESDAITLHIPLNESNRERIGGAEFCKMKPRAVLVNTARGEILKEEELYLALREGKLATAALDVFTEEPYAGKLTELENVILTQHMGSCSEDCRIAMETEAAEAILDYANGRTLKNPVP